MAELNITEFTEQIGMLEIAEQPENTSAENSDEDGVTLNACAASDQQSEIFFENPATLYDLELNDIGDPMSLENECISLDSLSSNEEPPLQFSPKIGTEVKSEQQNLKSVDSLSNNDKLPIQLLPKRVTEEKAKQQNLKSASKYSKDEIIEKKRLFRAKDNVTKRCELMQKLKAKSKRSDVVQKQKKVTFDINKKREKNAERHNNFALRVQKIRKEEQEKLKAKFEAKQERFKEISKKKDAQKKNLESKFLFGQRIKKS